MTVPSTQGHGEARPFAVAPWAERYCTVVYTMPGRGVSDHFIRRASKKEEEIRHHTPEERGALPGKTDWTKIDAPTDGKLKKLIADAPEEHDLNPDWTEAKLVLYEPRKADCLANGPIF